MSHCNCKNWRANEAGADKWGDCAADVWPRPTLGTCERCEKYDGPAERVVYTPLTVKPRRYVPPEALMGIPLAGDVIATITKRIGADRLVKLWEKWTGIPCGCEERRELMNRATERLVKWLRRSGHA